MASRLLSLTAMTATTRAFVFAAAVTACHHASTTSPDSAQVAPDGTSALAVTFTYTPSWDGVVSVDVLGGFGQSSDWTTPLVSLTQQGTSWTGTAMLPPGQYPYVFHVVGDAAAGTAKAGSLPHYAIDPTQPAFVACPSNAPAPIYNAMVSNPCSHLTVPDSGSPATLYSISGRVVVGTGAGSGYLVVLEREEPNSSATHHMFANRVTTAADGTYTLLAAAGNWRVQVQHPQIESMTDAQLSPMAMNILRRNISSSFAVGADVPIADVDMAYASYPAMSPTVSPATLPTTFTFASGSKAILDVYGTGMEIGDPWFGATATTTGSASFDGTFNKPQKMQPTVVANDKYFWGVEMPYADANKLNWTAQSLVFQISWSN